MSDSSPVKSVESRDLKKEKKKSIESTSSLERDFKNLFKRDKKKDSPVKKPNKLVEFLKPSKYKREKTINTQQPEERRHSFSSIYTIQNNPDSHNQSIDTQSDNVIHETENDYTNSSHTLQQLDSTRLSTSSTEPMYIEKSTVTQLTYFDSPETHEKIQALLEVLTDTEHVNVDGTETTPHDVYMTMLDRLDCIWEERMIGYGLTSV